MHQYEIPVGPSPVAPRIEAFALLAGLEAAVRGILISVMPLAMYDASGSAEAVSQSYFLAGLGSLIWGLMVPWATRFVPRRWMYSLGCGLYILSMGFAMLPHAGLMPLALLCMVFSLASLQASERRVISVAVDNSFPPYGYMENIDGERVFMGV